MSRTDNIAEFISTIKYEDLPPQVVKAAKNMIMDTLGVIVGTSRIHPEDAQIIWKTVEAYGGKPAATELMTGKKYPAGMAGMANAVLAHGMDFDDTHGAALTHTGASLVPSSLAVCEELEAGGKDMILAAVVGFEIAVRVGMCVMPSHYSFWHSTGTNPTFGVAALTAKLLGCTKEQIMYALGLAGTQAGGMITYLEYGDMSGALNPAKAVFNGVLSGILAKNGETAPKTMLEHEKGYSYGYCPAKTPKLEKLDEGLGSVYEILNNCPKLYPSLLASHTPIEATLSLVQEYNIKPENIKRITERTYNTVKSHFSNYHPENELAAQFSVPYCIAVAVAMGKMDLDSVTMDAIHNPMVQEILQKVEIIPDPELNQMYPEKFPAVVTIETNDGQSYTAERYYPKGDKHNLHTQKELEDKFRALISPVFGQEKTEKMIQLCNHLEECQNVKELAEMFVKGGCE